MPELPEVHTTTKGLNKKLPGLFVKSLETDWANTFKKITLPVFKKAVLGKKVKKVERRGKNILIDLENEKTILIHMKMTGHLMYGKWKKTHDGWKSELGGHFDDPYNRFIHVVFRLSNGYDLAFCDVRKFGKITLFNTKDKDMVLDLKDLGPEPLDKNFILEKFNERLNLRPRGKIKQVLMDQKIIAGIGNIYSDEMLWLSGIHPETPVNKVSDKNIRSLFTSMKEVLKKGIDFGGDSTSDYRNIDGAPGKFHHKHNAYRKTGEKCGKKKCSGKIERLKVGGRSAHFCNKHQKKNV